MIMPEFLRSNYIIKEPNNWHLADDAPDDIRKQFEEWKAEREEALIRGEFID